jgi:hypothetical protein
MMRGGFVVVDWDSWSLVSMFKIVIVVFIIKFGCGLYIGWNRFLRFCCIVGGSSWEKIVVCLLLKLLQVHFGGDALLKVLKNSW